MRRLTTLYRSTEASSLINWWAHYNPLRVYLNFVLIKLSQYSPSLRLRNALLRLTGAKIAPTARIGPGVTFDFFNPDLIEIGEGSIIGYGTTLLAHEFLVDELRTGPTQIGSRVLIGAHCTLLAGTQIGDGAQVSAMTLVNADVPARCLAGGVPVKVIRAAPSGNSPARPLPANPTDSAE